MYLQECPSHEHNKRHKKRCSVTVEAACIQNGRHQVWICTWDFSRNVDKGLFQCCCTKGCPGLFFVTIHANAAFQILSVLVFAIPYWVFVFPAEKFVRRTGFLNSFIHTYTKSGADLQMYQYRIDLFIMDLFKTNLLIWYWRSVFMWYYLYHNTYLFSFICVPIVPTKTGYNRFHILSFMCVCLLFVRIIYLILSFICVCHVFVLTIYLILSFICGLSFIYPDVSVKQMIKSNKR